jgi:hypothetical protein
MVKKKELKQRAIYVYPPANLAEKWKRLAGESKTSISKFVIEHVENSVNAEEAGFSSRTSIIEENRHLRETLNERVKRVDHLEVLVEKLEEDLRFYRSKMFTDNGFSGVRPYDKKLVELLREPGTHSSDEILSRLSIKPGESEAVKAVLAQLETFESSGLVKATRKGWTWQK